MKQSSLINRATNLLLESVKIRITFLVRALIGLMLCLSFGNRALAHPGSGIVVDKQGNVYFTDTGMGVWKIDKKGKVTYVPASKFHWMALDEDGYFSESQKTFGGNFERLTAQGVRPSLIMCSDFPFTVSPDGNIYYADTRHSSAKIIRRTPGGKETELMRDSIFEFISGIAVGPGGSLYITEASNPHSNTIRKITMNGQMSILATFTGKDGNNLPPGTEPSYCRGLAVDSAGVVYVAATGSRNILKITPDGVVTTFLQESSPWTPTGITTFHGEVYVLEWHDTAPSLQEVRKAWIPRVRKIGRDGRVRTLVTISRT